MNAGNPDLPTFTPRSQKGDSPRNEDHQHLPWLHGFTPRPGGSVLTFSPVEGSDTQKLSIFTLKILQRGKSQLMEGVHLRVHRV